MLGPFVEPQNKRWPGQDDCLQCESKYYSVISLALGKSQVVTLPPHLQAHKNTHDLLLHPLLPYEWGNEVLYGRLLQSNMDVTICYLSHIINNTITVIRVQ